jgi:hypothetical protein
MSAAALSIASAFGVPGTAGAIVTDTEGNFFLLSNYHVVFGGGAKPGDKVWGLRADDQCDQPIALVGWGRRGHIGRVTWQSETFFVDCALVEVADISTLPEWLHRALAHDWPTQISGAMSGMRVSKLGASTGITQGVLVDSSHLDCPFIGDRPWMAPKQLLIHPADADLNFSAPGDSGAPLLDETGCMLGLLWGSNIGGQGLACPIGPVMDCLGVVPAARMPWGVP